MYDFCLGKYIPFLKKYIPEYVWAVGIIFGGTVTVSGQPGTLFLQFEN